MSPFDRGDAVAIGVDIGGTSIRAARVAPDGRLEGHTRVRTDASEIHDSIRRLCSHLLDDDVRAVGIGVPGRLDADGATVISSGFVDLAGSRLGQRIEKALARPVVLANDASMALHAELQLGAASSVDHVVMFTVGTGVGGAVAIDRSIVTGRGNAGQLGHLSLDPRAPVCRCGRRGCVEVLASGTALARHMREAGLPDGTSIEALLQQGERTGDPAGVLARWAGAWRRAIDTVVATLDPDLVILGGGLGRAAAAALEHHGPPASSWFDRPVVAAGLGDDAGVIGAGLRALDHAARVDRASSPRVP